MFLTKTMKDFFLSGKKAGKKERKEITKKKKDFLTKIFTAVTVLSKKHSNRLLYESDICEQFFLFFFFFFFFYLLNKLSFNFRQLPYCPKLMLNNQLHLFPYSPNHFDSYTTISLHFPF